MDRGFGLDYVRIEALKQIAAALEAEILTTNDASEFTSLWLRTPGMHGDTLHFNAAILSEFRSLLADITKETGERRKNCHLEKVLVKAEKQLDLRQLDNQQLDRIRKGEHWILVLLSPYF